MNNTGKYITAVCIGAKEMFKTWALQFFGRILCYNFCVIVCNNICKQCQQNDDNDYKQAAHGSFVLFEAEPDVSNLTLFFAI